MNSGAISTPRGSPFGRIRSILLSENSASAFVWSIWFTLLLVDLFVLVTLGRNLPLTEDFWLVAPLTGNEPNLIQWLWAQNNEHRIAFPRMILLGLLRMSGGDWRVGMLVNILLLAAISAAFLLLARRLRGGHSHFVDAILPLTLLSLGHWENLYWSWQLTQVLPVVLTLILLWLIINLEGRLGPAAAVVAGLVLILLPLSGGNGLLWLSFCLPFFVFAAIRSIRTAPTTLNERLSVAFLLLAAIVACILGVLYLLGYEQPAWIPPNPGILPSLYAVLQFLALSLGPGARSFWLPAIAIVLLIIVPSLAVLLQALKRNFHKPEGMRTLGLAAYVANGLLFALALGYSRAAAIPVFGGWPTRYVLFSAPLLIAIFFVWLLYARTGLYRILAPAVGLLLLFLLPFNMWHGYEWYYWISQQDQQLMNDIRGGVPVEVLAERYQKSLSPHEPSHETAILLSWLKEDGLPPFNGNDDEAATFSINYYQPAARQVDLVWGVNGWQPLPDEEQPGGTFIVDGIMHSPMDPESFGHQITLTAPSGSTLDFGFLIRGADQDGQPADIWDANGVEDYHVITTNGGLFEARSGLIERDGVLQPAKEIPLVSREIVYVPPGEGDVSFLWGIDGWRVPPLGVDLSGSSIHDGVVHTPMVRGEDGRYSARITAPSGSSISCGFLTNQSDSRAGLIWDDECRLTTSGNTIHTFEATKSTNPATYVVLDNKPATSISLHYESPAALEVDLVWGINGFRPLPLADTPPGTVITDNGVLSTPMTRQDEEFTAELLLPAGSTFNYGFLVTERRPPLSLIRPAWDGDYEAWPVGREAAILRVTPGTFVLSPLPAGLPPSWPGWLMAIGALFLLSWSGLMLLGSQFSLSAPSSNSVADSIFFLRNRHQRDLLRELVIRDLKLRYRRSYLGILWSLINPLLQLVVLGLVFSFILPLEIDHYPLFLFIGLLPWIWFQSSLLTGTTSIVDNRDLIRRPGFRSGILPVQSVCSNLIHFLLSLPVVLFMVLLLRAELGASVVLLPVIIIVQFLFTLGIVNFLAALHVTFRDTQHLVGVFLLLWFYLTPIFYNVGIIPEQYQAAFSLNPMLHIVNAYRDVLMYGQWPPILPLIAITLFSLLAILVGHRTLIAANNRLVEEL